MALFGETTNAEAFLLAAATGLANPLLATDATAGMRNDRRIEVRKAFLLHFEL
jgi:hypothetical protein